MSAFDKVVELQLKNGIPQALYGHTHGSVDGQYVPCFRPWQMAPRRESWVAVPAHAQVVWGRILPRFQRRAIHTYVHESLQVDP